MFASACRKSNACSDGSGGEGNGDIAGDEELVGVEVENGDFGGAAPLLSIKVERTLPLNAESSAFREVDATNASCEPHGWSPSTKLRLFLPPRRFFFHARFVR